MKLSLRVVLVFFLLLINLHCFSEGIEWPFSSSESSRVDPQVKESIIFNSDQTSRSTSSASVHRSPSDSSTHDEPRSQSQHNECRVDMQKLTSIAAQIPIPTSSSSSERQRPKKKRRYWISSDTEDESNWLKRFYHRLKQLVPWRHDNVGTLNNNPPGAGESQAEEVKRAKEYYDQGISFKLKASSTYDVSFNWGVLKISKLRVDEKSLEDLCRRILREQSGGVENYTSYIEFMALFVKEEEDVNLLSKEGILICGVDNAKDTARMIQKLGHWVRSLRSSSTVPNHLEPTCQSLNEFYHNKTKVWLALNKREIEDFFYYPCRLIPHIVSIVVITLAVLHYIKK